MILVLNHVYNGKVVICPINNKQWIKTTDNFTKQLTKKGVSKEHTLDLCDTLDSNYEKILQFEDSGTEEEEEDEEEEERIEDTLMETYNFRTMDDTREIYYYNESKGIYVGNGDILIETLTESMKDGDVTTGIVNEVMNHIRRRQTIKIEWSQKQK